MMAKSRSDDELAFLAALHAAPDDDSLRLVYADWLDECGCAGQAEYIRIEVHSRDAGRYADTYSRLRALRGELIRSSPAWYAQVNRDLYIPSDLSPRGREAADTILSLLVQEKRLDTGGGMAFYSPTQWRARDEEYGLDSVLILCHDGGALGEVLGSGGEVAIRFHDRLRRRDFLVENCTGWYSAVYENRPTDPG